MKKLITICLLLTTIFNANAQKQEFISYSRTATIEDLKGFIGIKTAGLEKEMKKRGFPIYNKNEDGTIAQFSYKYFYDHEDEEMELIIDKNAVIGVGYEGFTASDHYHILKYFEDWDWVKTINEKMIVKVGLERTDLWVSEDKKWKVRIDYLKGGSGMKNTITKITLTSAVLEYYFE